MPGYDGTGPEGSGPYGRGLGPCGRGLRGTYRGFFGMRRGRGGGRRFWPLRWRGDFPLPDEKSQLDSEKAWLSQQLAEVNNRINEIESTE